MPIRYWSVRFFKKSSGHLYSFIGFTSDEALFNRIVRTTEMAVDDASIRERWAASRDEGQGEAEDVQALKAKLGEGAEETKEGCWSTWGCK
jgi:hypothetical protein